MLSHVTRYGYYQNRKSTIHISMKAFLDIYYMYLTSINDESVLLRPRHFLHILVAELHIISSRYRLDLVEIRGDKSHEETF